MSGMAPNASYASHLAGGGGSFTRSAVAAAAAAESFVVPTAAGGPALAEGWARQTDPATGLYYYWHAGTRCTTWEPPLATPAASVSDDEPDLFECERDCGFLHESEAVVAQHETTCAFDASMDRREKCAHCKKRGHVKADCPVFAAEAAARALSPPPEPEPPAPPPIEKKYMPDGWSKHEAPVQDTAAGEEGKGKHYYWNRATRVSVWHKPSVRISASLRGTPVGAPEGTATLPAAGTHGAGAVAAAVATEPPLAAQQRPAAGGGEPLPWHVLSPPPSFSALFSIAAVQEALMGAMTRPQLLCMRVDQESKDWVRRRLQEQDRGGLTMSAADMAAGLGVRLLHHFCSLPNARVAPPPAMYVLEGVVSDRAHNVGWRRDYSNPRWRFGFGPLLFAEGVVLVGQAGVEFTGAHRRMEVGSGATGVELESLQLPRGLEVQSGSDCTMKHCEVSGRFVNVVDGAKLAMEQCRVHSSGGYGIECRGSLRASHSIVEGNADSGVFVTGQRASADLEECTVRGNGSHGVRVTKGTCTMRGGAVSDSKRDGVLVQHGGKCTVTRGALLAAAAALKPQTLSEGNDGADWHTQTGGEIEGLKESDSVQVTRAVVAVVPAVVPAVVSAVVPTPAHEGLHPSWDAAWDPSAPGGGKYYYWNKSNKSVTQWERPAPYDEIMDMY